MFMREIQINFLYCLSGKQRQEVGLVKNVHCFYNVYSLAGLNKFILRFHFQNANIIKLLRPQF